MGKYYCLKRLVAQDLYVCEAGERSTKVCFNQHEIGNASRGSGYPHLNESALKFSDRLPVIDSVYIFDLDLRPQKKFYLTSLEESRIDFTPTLEHAEIISIAWRFVQIC